MLRSLLHRLKLKEAGQALPLFGLMFMILIGFTAMSIDVGRYVWARTSMQAGVDAAALAAAQSMPSQTAADAKATEYWIDNSGFIQSAGQNVSFTVTYPPGNKAITVRGEADIPTWFAKFFGVPSWHVSAEGQAESQVLDISVVLDISGSMCFDSFFQVENSIAYQMSPGRLTPAGGFAFPKLSANIDSSQTSITLNSISIFTSATAATNRSNFGTSFNTTTPYWQFPTAGTADDVPTSDNLRRGVIMIGNEIMRITAVNTSTNTLTVIRGYRNEYTNVNSPASAHSANDEVWANRTGYSSTNNYCELASYYAGSAGSNGPHMPFDGAIDNAQYFTTLFSTAYDKLGLASYSTTATNLQGLTTNHASVASQMDSEPTMFFPTGGTNIAHGLAMGRFILDGPGKRANAVRVIVILTDGVPTNYCSNGAAYTDSATACSASSSTTPANCGTTYTAMTHAYNQADAAAAAEITVYVIGLGDTVIDCILQEIADRGGGTYYKAPTVAQLDEAFQAIAEATHIALVK